MGTSDGNGRRADGPSRGPFGVYYGWINVAVALLSTMLVVGSTLYSFGLFVKPVSEELGIGRAQLNLGLICLSLGCAFLNPGIGRIFDRHSPVRILRLSAIPYAAGMLIISMTNSPLVMAVCLLFLLPMTTVVCGLFGIVLVTRWFNDLRNRALTLAAVGTSVGGVAVYPIIAFMMSFMTWRMTLASLGLAVPAILLLLSLIARDAPERNVHDVFADGQSHFDGTSLKVGQIVRMPRFWVIAIPVALMLGVDQTLLATITPYLLDRSFSLSETAGIMSSITASAILGKLLIAWVADRINLTLLLALTAVFGAILCATLLSAPSYTPLLVVCWLTGIAIGGTSPLASAAMVRQFGARSAGVAMGCLFPVVSMVAMPSLYYAGASFDRTGSYSAAFEIFLAMMVIALVLLVLPDMWRARQRAQSKQQQPFAE